MAIPAFPHGRGLFCASRRPRVTGQMGRPAIIATPAAASQRGVAPAQAACNLAHSRFRELLAVVEAEALGYTSMNAAGPPSSSRRRLLRTLAAAALPIWPRLASAQASTPIPVAIPATGEVLPAIGVRKLDHFNVPPDTDAAAALVPVLRTFFERGGSMIDSSPMYGYSETIIGGMLRQVPHPRLFSATKIWTVGKTLGEMQFERSLRLGGVPKLDLVHIHNLLGWETHLPTLKAQKAAGHVRYIGVTTSEGAKHDEMERALKRERFDFVAVHLQLRRSSRRGATAPARRGARSGGRHQPALRRRAAVFGRARPDAARLDPRVRL